MTWDVHTGRPSWHQQRAGHISSGVMGGFETREKAEEYLRNFKKHHPNEPAFILPTPDPAKTKKSSRWDRGPYR